MCFNVGPDSQHLGVELHRVLFVSAVGEKLLHPWIRGPVRPAARRRSGHAAAPRCRAERSHAAEAVMGL